MIKEIIEKGLEVEKISNTELAKKMGVKLCTVSNLKKQNHINLSTLIKLAYSLNATVKITFKNGDYIEIK